MRMELHGGEHDERLAALELRPEYMALALKMPGPVRDLVVFNRDPTTVAVNDVLAGLGLPAVAPRPAAYPGLRSLALLNLLPKSTGPESKVLHSHFALEPSACAQLRSAVESASFSAADSVDGCIDYQLNLTRAELERIVGATAVNSLWTLAHRAHSKFCGEDEDEDEEEEEEEEEEGEESPEGEREQLEANGTITDEHSLLDVHEIFVRRYTPNTRPWFPFHRDRSELTINVALADDKQHEGGRLICLLDGAVRRIERSEGMATVHPSSFMHAVSRMTSGVRYSLIIFMGRSKRILAFNEEVRKVSRRVSSVSGDEPGV